MARRTVNRKDLRAENDAAEAMEKAEGESGSGKKTKKAAAPKKKTKKAAKEVRLKAFWGVFNQSLKRVALYEYSERKQADKKASELTTSQKTPHFVQVVKEQIEA
jgi:chromatin segregation and condensation protein Rec8/ScpA/Scc1 (kleisin family)